MRALDLSEAICFVIPLYLANIYSSLTTRYYSLCSLCTITFSISQKPPFAKTPIKAKYVTFNKEPSCRCGGIPWFDLHRRIVCKLMLFLASKQLSALAIQHFKKLKPRFIVILVFLSWLLLQSKSSRYVSFKSMEKLNTSFDYGIIVYADIWKRVILNCYWEQKRTLTGRFKIWYG